MNKITKRIVAGASALALLASAVGVDQLADLFMKTSYAVGYKGKNALSTGFSNLEQDTNKDGYYNTGYGLHTNKTATAVGTDGRTFDVNLESWYVGENPVDVATILDASGSMAWTVNTLDPMKVNEQLDADDKLYLTTKYKTESLAEIQAANGGYLPQDVVDLILDPENTDDTKLSYAGYKYYVYEARSSVSEFVPLGYWDGGADPKNDDSLIGYYPFSGDLKNKAPKATEGAEGMLINHPTSGGTYNTSEKAAETLKAEFSTQEVDVLNSKGKPTGKKETVVKGLNIADSSSKGAILVDSPKTNKFSISFYLSVDNSDGGYDDATILYLTDGTNNYKLYRGGAGSAARLKMSSSGGSAPLNANKAVNSEPREWTFTFDFDNNQLKIHTSTENVQWVNASDKTTGQKDYTVSLAGNPKLDVSKLQIYIGGDTTKHSKQNTIYIKDLSIKDIKEDGTANEVAYYPLETGENGLKNTVDGNNPPKFVEQAYNNGGKFGTDEIGTHLLEPVYRNNKALDVKKTSQNGAVSIDAVPKLDEGFTISMKLYRTASLDKAKGQQNIFYLGDKNNNNKYYQFFRSAIAGGYVGISNSVQKDFEKSPPEETDMVYYQGGMAGGSEKEEVWYTNTLVFETDPADPNKYIVTPYINGKAEYQSGSKNNFKIDKITVAESDLVFLICALKKNGSGSEQYLDDLYVFDNALNATQVAQYFGEKELCEGSTKDKDGKVTKALYHATTVGNEDIAQISESLANNTKIDERRGWYYVNSHSTWADVTGCLASGKQYIGIFTDDGLDGSFKDMANDTATIPAGFAEGDQKQQEIARDIKSGDTNEGKYEAPKTERSIRFYVDSQNHLRCFVWSGNDTTKEDDKRTFCSVVYTKQSNQKTKYEELNSALNTFYQNLAAYSDLSNTSVVRFSTINAVDKDKTDKTETNLKNLIMKDWTNWSDYYQNVKNSGAEPDEGDYLHDLLIPKDGEKATNTEDSSTRDIKEYPYVMTGGTYTWTGLKAFYDNMVDKKELKSGDKVYDIANDARDKYLIIFTDGRDNTQDYNVSDVVSKDEGKKLEGSPDYDNISGTTFGGTKYVDTYNPYKDDKDHKVGFSIEIYDDYKGEKTDYYYNECQVQEFKTGDHTIQYDGDLAQAWADKLKDEGYTIYCVMLATGSISSTANADEYNKAKNFLKSLSGGKDVDKEIAEKQADMDSWSEGTKPDEYARVQREIEALRDNYVLVVDPSTGTSSLEDAFEQILEQIQKPRNDYTVQDYIDPRFNLIGEAYFGSNDKPQEVIYHLGANGTVTFTDTNNKPIETEDDRIYFDNAYGSKTSYSVSGVTVGDIIDISGANGLAYTPQNSYMVNRKSDEDKGDEIGTGYLYYDDENDMYYLRWEEQIIPMSNKTFDTDGADGTGEKLDVWSATIRLKAKDDFIGGNNILTNGNEAGENLVYSDATIENMDKNPELYFSDTKTSHTLREKLQVLSGTDRKINAVDAGGVSQAVYGDGIDIPSSGFPRTTVNVRLLKLDAKNLNDVIYMGEVVSPTMMLADLENDYMTGSYYLEYLERYAYRLYGYDAAKTPLLELLNQWLKIDDKNEFEKTFTIPYIYLPDPIYKNDNTLETEEVDGKDKVKVSNSTGMSTKNEGDYIIADFEDLNLRDVTGFITYTWKRVYKEGEEREPQQKVGSDYDITLDYVVKNTNQIKYNLELKFTPLHEGALAGFDLEKEKFITDATGTVGDSFFKVDTDESSSTYNEFVESTENKWVFTNRSDYLKAMISETHTYTPHVIYDTAHGKWALVDDDKEDFTTSDALSAYKGEDKQITISGNTLTDKGVYDWDNDYKPEAGDEQIVGDKLTDYYTSTPHNVGMADKDGVTITKENGDFKDGYGKDDVYSLVANTTYTKDVVNAALALEIYVDGKYLQRGMPMAKRDTFTFEATRYYDDPLDPLPYGDDIDADTGTVSSSGNVGGKKYQLTFTVDNKTLPTSPASSEIYRLWAELTKVEVYDDTTGEYIPIKGTSVNPYTGYLAEDALPIGTYEISVSDTNMAEDNETSQYYLGTAKDESSPGHFRYLKIENDAGSYTHDRFPNSVVSASADAVKDTGDNEYQIWNEKSDYSKANIAENNRVKDSTNQTVTFYFGTVKDGIGKKGVSRTELKEGDSDYAKDRLGIIMLSASANSLAITKEVTRTNTSTEDYKKQDWEFTVTVTPEKGEAASEFKDQNDKGFKLTWYKLSGDGSWQLDSTSHSGEALLQFSDDDGDGTYTATVSLKHHEKVVIGDLSEGTWQVKEETVSGVLYTPHNDQYIYGEDEWQYKNAAETRANIELSPASQVNYVNEFPHELPSTGGSGIVRLIFLGSAFTLCSVMLFAILRYNCRKRRTMKK